MNVQGTTGIKDRGGGGGTRVLDQHLGIGEPLRV